MVNFEDFSIGDRFIFKAEECDCKYCGKVYIVTQIDRFAIWASHNNEKETDFTIGDLDSMTKIDN